MLTAVCCAFLVYFILTHPSIPPLLTHSTSLPLQEYTMFAQSPSNLPPVAAALTFCPACVHSKCQFSGAEKARHSSSPGICQTAPPSFLILFLFYSSCFVSMFHAADPFLIYLFFLCWSLSHCDHESHVLLCTHPL